MSDMGAQFDTSTRNDLSTSKDILYHVRSFILTLYRPNSTAVISE